jgi:heme A synthase
LEAINQWRSWHPELSLDRVTLAQVWIHFTHRAGAVVVTVAIAALVVRVMRRRRSEPLLVRPALLLTVLLLTQLTLGVLTVLWQKPADLTTLHVAVGALTLVTTFTIAVRAMRLTATTQSTTSEGKPKERPHPVFPIESAAATA